MSLSLHDVEVLALAIARMHRHPEPESYAEGVKDAWRELVADAESRGDVAPQPAPQPAPPAPAPSPAPQTAEQIEAAALAQANNNQGV